MERDHNDNNTNKRPSSANEDGSNKRHETDPPNGDNNDSSTDVINSPLSDSAISDATTADSSESTQAPMWLRATGGPRRPRIGAGFQAELPPLG